MDIEIRLAQSVSGAQGPMVSDQLIQGDSQGTFIEIQLARQSDGLCHQHSLAIPIKSPERLLRFTAEPFRTETDVGTSGEFMVDADAERFESAARGNAPGAFGKNGTIGLVEAGDLDGFEPDAGIEEETSERSSPGGSEMGFAERGPHEADLGRDAFVVSLARIEGCEVNVEGIIDAIIAEARGEAQ